MKGIIVSVLVFALYGCSSSTFKELKASTADSVPTKESVSELIKPTETAEVAVTIDPVCIGSTELPAGLEGQFDKIVDTELLNETLGEADKGKLCQGQVYQSKKEVKVTLFRGWNSTNPYSKMGKWWAWDKPTGSVAKYREDYEICYQWSPLDKLVSCTLEAGQKVVVGTGQSAFCSDYLSYPVSAEQQVYIANASAALSNCTELDGEFSWK